MEGDILVAYLHRAAAEISIHALRVEGDTRLKKRRRDKAIFLSTPSGWRATSVYAFMRDRYGFLSTPSGWRATAEEQERVPKTVISIHALRVEGDQHLFAVL